MEDRPAGPRKAEHEHDCDHRDVPRRQRPSAPSQPLRQHRIWNPSTSHLLIPPQLLVAPHRLRAGGAQPRKSTQAFARVGLWGAAFDLHAREGTSRNPASRRNLQACGKRGRKAELTPRVAGGG
ncbi:hypothetical protein GCM10009744_13190 [Kribbella alba]|uniref:Uncharacterized protein n=1 Tax=Kribbella alba TaxID=190197 RepID=A0ABP4QX54_9ACTN